MEGGARDTPPLCAPPRLLYLRHSDKVCVVADPFIAIRSSIQERFLLSDVLALDRNVTIEFDSLEAHSLVAVLQELPSNYLSGEVSPHASRLLSSLRDSLSSDQTTITVTMNSAALVVLSQALSSLPMCQTVFQLLSRILEYATDRERPVAMGTYNQGLSKGMMCIEYYRFLSFYFWKWPHPTFTFATPRKLAEGFPCPSFFH